MTRKKSAKLEVEALNQPYNIRIGGEATSERERCFCLLAVDFDSPT